MVAIWEHRPSVVLREGLDLLEIGGWVPRMPVSGESLRRKNETSRFVFQGVKREG